MHTGGHCLFLVENAKPLDLHLLKSKSVPFVWEFMFTSSMYRTPDMANQGQLLNEVAALMRLENSAQHSMKRCRRSKQKFSGRRMPRSNPPAALAANLFSAIGRLNKRKPQIAGEAR